MSFLEEFRRSAKGIDPMVVKDVLDGLEKSGMAKRLDFLAALNGHGPPLVEYTVAVTRFRAAKIEKGVDESERLKEVQKLFEEIKGEFGDRLLIDLNTVIRDATARDRLAIKPRRFSKGARGG